MKGRKLLGVGLILIIVITGVRCSGDRSARAGAGRTWNAIKTADLAAIQPDLFTPEEWYVPYYLQHFSRVANSVLPDGENKGFINISVWRTPDVNKPYNARIMESILSLVWFYTTDRPWNPYYADPDLRVRIEAALTFWCNMQNEDGRFSEYAYNRWGLAPTAFATKFIGRALYLLEEGPEIDKDVLARTKSAMRKALFISFTDEGLWEHGRNFTNQYANLWGGACMYLKKNKDQVVDQLFINRLDQSMAGFQSPCGYFYEKNGPDWGYNLSTHHSDLHVAWHYARGTGLQEYFVEKAERWYDWFSYNAVKEPGSSRYYLNKAVETRQREWYFDSDTLYDPRSYRWTPLAEYVPVARAFSLSKPEYEAQVQQHYRAMRNKYPQVDSLNVGEFSTFSPYAFLHNELIKWFPAAEQKAEAVRALPYLKEERFVEVRYDKRNNTTYSFVRRPSYYTTFNSGNILTDQQRYGLGLVWHPAMGTVLQSQSASDIAAWGTRAAGSRQVYEASDLPAGLAVGDHAWTPMPGSNRPEGRLSVSYKLKEAGDKAIRFDAQAIRVSVHHKGPFTEIIPLLVGKDVSMTIGAREVMLKNKNGTMTIKANKGRMRKLDDVISTHTDKPCRVIEIEAGDNLEYTITFN